MLTIMIPQDHLLEPQLLQHDLSGSPRSLNSYNMTLLDHLGASTLTLYDLLRSTYNYLSH